MDDIYTKKPEECAYSFTQHRACEFFPCHKTSHPEDFNCLFCYCPLYTLGSHCGGNIELICRADNILGIKATVMRQERIDAVVNASVALEIGAQAALVQGQA